MENKKITENNEGHLYGYIEPEGGTIICPSCMEEAHRNAKKRIARGEKYGIPYTYDIRENGDLWEKPLLCDICGKDIKVPLIEDKDRQDPIVEDLIEAAAEAEETIPYEELEAAADKRRASPVSESIPILGDPGSGRSKGPTRIVETIPVEGDEVPKKVYDASMKTEG